MKKIIPAILLLAALLCGCAGGKTESSYTVEQAEAILTSGAFEGSDMGKVDGAIAAVLYGIAADTVTDSVCYIAANTSVSADELAIFVFSDETAAQAAVAALQARVQSQIAVCESYAPAAVSRLEKAVIRQRGASVLYAVGDPEVLSGLSELQ